MRSGVKAIFLSAFLAASAHCAAANEPSSLLQAAFPPSAKSLALRAAPAAQGAGQQTSGAWISPEFSVSSALWTRVWLELDAATYAKIATIEAIVDGATDSQPRVLWRNPGGEPDEEDLLLSLPQINDPRFKLRAVANASADAADLSVALARVLVQRDDTAGEAAKLTLDGVEAALTTVSDQRLVRRYVGRQQFLESTIRGANWERLVSSGGAEVPDYLKSYALSVPRISRRAPACIVDQLSDQESKREADNMTLGCTAFRVGEDLFATAWHCVPDSGNGGCDNIKLHFGYRSSDDEGGRGAIAREKCKAVVFRSSRLDFAIIRTERTKFEKWSSAPVLKFVTGRGNLPFHDEPLAILHYPAPDEYCNPRAREADTDGQLGLRLSRWTKSARGGLCKVRGKGVEGTGKRYELNPPKDPKHVCELARRANRDLAFGHSCATCEGTSGAPVISMSDEAERQGRVLGVHVNGADDDNPDRLPNRAVRSHAVADCLDLAALQDSGTIQAAAGAETRDVCKCAGDDVCAPPAPQAAPAAAASTP